MTDATPSGTDVAALTASELSQGYRHKDFSPVEVARATLARIAALQPRLNCYITLCEDAALVAARASEARWLRGEPLGALDGVPYSVKDIVNTRGLRTTHGSIVHADNVPDCDALAVARMRQAGAVLVGKTTTSEFGAKCLTDAPLFGSTPNAWSRAHTSGGSSGGAAVAVAAGLAPLAIATDGGGSTRIPAACNGVVGFKQSLGVVPHSQVQDAFSNYTYVTPIARTAEDTALMLQVLAGEDASDPWSMGVPAGAGMGAVAPQGALHGRRIGFARAPQGRPLATAVATAFDAALALLQAQGAQVEEVTDLEVDVEPLWRVINHTSWRARFAGLAQAHGSVLTPSLLQQLALVRDVTADEYQAAMFARTALYRRVAGLLARYDFIATPTLNQTALPVDQDLFGEIEIDGVRYPGVRPHWFPWTMPFNLTGHPAVSVPCGWSPAGLPIGLQLVGGFKQDAALLAAAWCFESACAAGRSPLLAGRD